MAPGLARPIIELYAPEHQIRASQATSRVTSIFGNPNTNGFMTLALLLAPLAFFCAVRPLAKHWIPALATLTAGGLYVIIISGSRTSFTTMVAILGIVPLIVGNRKVVAGSFAAISLLFICREQVIEAVHNENAYLADGLKTLLMFDFDSLFTKGTFARRFDHWREAMDFFVSSPLLGAGPLRSRIGSATDNFYIYVLSRYGVLGLGAFVLLWAKVIALCVVGLGRKDANVRFLALFVLALTGAILVGNVSIEAQIIPPIASLYFVTLGAFLGCLYRDERQRSLAPEVA
jgi:O-antigen ligase